MPERVAQTADELVVVEALGLRDRGPGGMLEGRSSSVQPSCALRLAASGRYLG